MQQESLILMRNFSFERTSFAWEKTFSPCSIELSISKQDTVEEKKNATVTQEADSRAYRLWLFKTHTPLHYFRSSNIQA